MATTKLSSKYQIVIPKEIRRKMRLSVGTRITLQPLDERRALIVKRPKDAVEELRGLGKEVWKSLGGATKYIRSERRSWDKKR